MSWLSYFKPNYFPLCWKGWREAHDVEYSISPFNEESKMKELEQREARVKQAAEIVKKDWETMNNDFSKRVAEFKGKPLLDAADIFVVHAEAYMKCDDTKLGEKVQHYVKTAAALEKMKELLK